MYTNKIAALAGVVAVIDQAAALNIFRQKHQLEKKQEVVWNTVVETIYVTAGATEPTTTAYVDSGKITTTVVLAVPTQNPKVELPLTQKARSPTTIATSLKTSPTGGSSLGGSSKGPGFSGKRGLAYEDPVLANLVGSSCKKGVCGWAYNWGQNPGSLDSQYSFVPTLWGRKSPDSQVDFFATWSSSASKAISNGAKALFSFNEPDNKSQANMSPADAAKFHVQQMNPFSGKALVGAPSVSNSNLAGEGLQWLKSWVSQCKSQGCKYDFCNVHWYSPVNAIDTLFDHIEQAHKICDGKPVWLTEFAPIGATPAQTADFLAKAVPRLDSLDYLHAYSYFMVGSKDLQLLASSSSLSTIGTKYVSL